jgi:peptide/nickel transport system substrate-binding protein
MQNQFSRVIPALVCLLLVACAPQGPAATGTATSTASRSGGILRIGQAAADIGTADPHYASGTQDRALVDMVYNGLVRFKPGDATSFEPDLATSLPGPITDAQGKQTWTFFLRKGVMCHPSDGMPAYELTSDDVMYSLKKAASKDTSTYSSDYAGMTFTSSDMNSVTITLDKPLSSALFYPRVANYSGGYIVCSKAAERLGIDGLKTHPVGTGPFMFKSYTPKEKIDLVANDLYFRGRPQLDGVEYRYMADVSSRELGLRSGQLDVIFGLQDGKWVDRLSRTQDVKVDVFGVGEVSTVYFNVTRPPFDDPRVRKAVANALNRDEFLAIYGSSVAQKTFSPVPEAFMAGGLTEMELINRNLEYRFDPTKAKQLLAEAGLGNGFRFSVVTSLLEHYRLIYESMQAQLA